MPARRQAPCVAHGDDAASCSPASRGPRSRRQAVTDAQQWQMPWRQVCSEDPPRGLRGLKQAPQKDPVGWHSRGRPRWRKQVGSAASKWGGAAFRNREHLRASGVRRARWRSREARCWGCLATAGDGGTCGPVKELCLCSVTHGKTPKHPGRVGWGGGDRERRESGRKCRRGVAAAGRRRKACVAPGRVACETGRSTAVCPPPAPGGRGGPGKSCVSVPTCPV